MTPRAPYGRVPTPARVDATTTRRQQWPHGVPTSLWGCPRLPLPSGQRVHVARRLCRDDGTDRFPRPPRPRPGVVQRAPLRGRRLPAELRARRRCGRGGHDAIRISTDIALAPFAHPCAWRRTWPSSTSCPTAGWSSASGWVTPRTSSGVRHPARPPRLADRGARGHPAARVGGRAVQLRRQALPFDDVMVTPHRCSPAVRRCGRRPPVRRARPGRALRHPRAAAGRAARARPVAGRACGRSRPQRATGRDHPRVLVTDDPEREWPPPRDAERYRMTVYGGFAEEAGLGGRAVFPDQERISQHTIIGGVETARRAHRSSSSRATGSQTW